MGYDLRTWALNIEHSCLTPRTRQVLVAICFVAHDEHGEFWMRGKRLILEHLPDMSYGTYRNCISTLVQNDLLIKIAHGGGRTAHGRGTGNQYRVNSPVVRNPQPDQGVLPDITKSPDALLLQPEVDEQTPVEASAVHQRVDELLATGITPEQMLAFMEFVEETMKSSQNRSRPDRETGHEGDGLSRNRSRTVTSFSDVPEKQVTDNDQFVRNRSSAMTSFDEETGHENEKQVTGNDEFVINRSLSVTSHPIHEEKGTKEKKDHAAAACKGNRSRSVTSFFELLAAALATAGYSGIRAAQFADLSGFLADYTNVTGSPPDQRTAEYIVGRVSESRDVRNIVGFARKITQDVLTTGEGYVAYEPPPPAPPPERPSEPLPPPDWNTLHLAHIEQDSPSQEIWDSVLDVLRNQVSRPAFETWLSESSGAAYAEGQFIVGTANSFASEMLRNRLHPLIERALRDVTHTDVIIHYAVVPLEDRGECPICEALEAQQAAAS